MTKQELVRAISHETGIDQPTALASVEALMNIIKDTMASGENVYLNINFTYTKFYTFLNIFKWYSTCPM